MKTIDPRRIATPALAFTIALAMTAGCASRTASVAGPSRASAGPASESSVPSSGGAVPSSVSSAPSDSAVPSGVKSVGDVRHVMSSVVSAELWDSGLSSALADLAMSPTAQKHLAVAGEYRRLGIFDDALRHLTAATRSRATRAAAHDALARLWRDAGHPAVAVGHAHRAVAYAGTAASHNTLGTILLTLGWVDAARNAFTKAVALDAAAAYAWSNLCYSFYLTSDFDRATEACEAALAIDANLATARNNLALAYAATGRLSSAAAEFDRSGDVAQGRYNMGLVYFALGEFERAAGEFEVAYRMRPSLQLAGIRARQSRALAGTR